jgi:hypothetical protein
VYFQPNSCNTHAGHEWAQGTFLRQPRKVPPAHAQRVYLQVLKLDGLAVIFPTKPYLVELHLNSVFRFSIGWYFPGILPTDTKG